MCDRPNGAEYLGLHNLRNYIEVTEDNFTQTMKRALADEEGLSKIARNGAELILARHTVDIRAREFNEVVSAILHGKQPGGWAEMFEMRKCDTVHTSLEAACCNKTFHITEVANKPDKQAVSIWYKYGLNNRPYDNPPVVTEFPELVILRGVYLRQLAEEMRAERFAEVGTARGFQSMLWRNIWPTMVWQKDLFIPVISMGWIRPNTKRH